MQGIQGSCATSKTLFPSLALVFRCALSAAVNPGDHGPREQLLALEVSPEAQMPPNVPMPADCSGTCPLANACWKKRSHTFLELQSPPWRVLANISVFSLQVLYEFWDFWDKARKKQTACFPFLAPVLYSMPACPSLPSYPSQGSKIWQQMSSAKPVKIQAPSSRTLLPNGGKPGIKRMLLGHPHTLVPC